MTAGDLLRRAGIDPDLVGALAGGVNPDAIRVRRGFAPVRLLWGPGIDAVAWGRLILVAPKALTGDASPLGRLIVHELVHVAQWRRLGLAGFARRYLSQYWRGRRRGLGHRDAYLAIDLEVEARTVAARFR